MKRIIKLITVCICLLASCKSTSVSRMDEDTTKDLSGYWNDTDIKIVTDSLVNDCISSKFIETFEEDYGRLPRVKIGVIRNLSDEHIDTELISTKFRNSIINSQVMEFVSSNNEVTYLRDEILNQADHASADSASEFDNELGADFMLLGTVKTVTDSLDNETVKTYYINMELHDIETSVIKWSGENSQIRKYIKRNKVKF